MNYSYNNSKTVVVAECLLLCNYTCLFWGNFLFSKRKLFAACSQNLLF